MRVILDTNVLVSAVLGGSTRSVLVEFRSGAFELIASGEIVAEYAAVLRRDKFGLPPDTVDAILEYLLRHSYFVTPTEKLRVVMSDPNDDMVLEAAVAGEADVIVSGDSHLLAITSFRGIPILGVQDFLARLTAPTKGS